LTKLANYAGIFVWEALAIFLVGEKLLSKMTSRLRAESVGVIRFDRREIEVDIN